MKYRITQLFIFSAMFLSGVALAQDSPAYSFSSKKDVGITPLKPASSMSECWILSATEFLESEIFQLQGSSVEISDLAILYNFYQWKARLYVKNSGSFPFGPRGKPQDILSMIEEKGFLPTEGFTTTGTTPEQFPGEMVAALKGTMSVVMKKNAGNFDQRWQDQFNATIENYLGVPLDEITLENQKMDALQYRRKLLPKPSDYITLTNLPDKPEYSEISINEPDNWNHNKCYNIPINELVEVIDQILLKNHMVLWNGVITEEMVYKKERVIVLPEKKLQASYTSPVIEKRFDSGLRSGLFDNFTQGSDTYLLITGKSVDQNKNVFFKAVNCCGNKNHVMNNDQVIISQNAVMANTLSIMVNRNLLPDSLNRKLGFVK